jgi:23S rRNA (pseudouridine1915-N3)-methyltransferase
MNLDVIAVDKMRESYVRDGCAMYRKRLAPYISVNVIEVKAQPNDLESEGRSLLARVAADSVVWVLDREGALLDSVGLAGKLAAVERSGNRRLALIIGGPAGLHDSLIEAADFRWSLSPLTFLHEMTRLLVLEQLYRAIKINRGEPYHR